MLYALQRAPYTNIFNLSVYLVKKKCQIAIVFPF
jgi:hypothetical protein